MHFIFKQKVKSTIKILQNALFCILWFYIIYDLFFKSICYNLKKTLTKLKIWKNCQALILVNGLTLNTFFILFFKKKWTLAITNYFKIVRLEGPQNQNSSVSPTRTNNVTPAISKAYDRKFFRRKFFCPLSLVKKFCGRSCQQFSLCLRRYL